MGMGMAMAAGPPVPLPVAAGSPASSPPAPPWRARPVPCAPPFPLATRGGRQRGLALQRLPHGSALREHRGGTGSEGV